jgi:hypothetical protein
MSGLQAFNQETGARHRVLQAALFVRELRAEGEAEAELEDPVAERLAEEATDTEPCDSEGLTVRGILQCAAGDALRDACFDYIEAIEARE